MNRDFHLSLLGVGQDATPEERKQAYRALVRRHHPDRFPPEERELQRWKMVQINEAYHCLRDEAGMAHTVEGAAPEVAPDQEGASAAGTEIGFVRDPAYVYYKQGFVHFSKAVGGMMDREKQKLTADEGGLRRALYALGEFHRAHGYFLRVISDFPESIWRADAEYKLRRIEGFNRVYHRIRRNLARRAQTQNAQEGA